MCNHYRQAILKGETIPGWSIDQFSEIKVPLRFHSIAPVRAALWCGARGSLLRA